MNPDLKRALVIFLTKFRGAHTTGRKPALRLLRTRHWVLLTSLRERTHRQHMHWALDRHEQVVVVAAPASFRAGSADCV